MNRNDFTMWFCAKIGLMPLEKTQKRTVSLAVSVPPPHEVDLIRFVQNRKESHLQRKNVSRGCLKSYTPSGAEYPTSRSTMESELLQIHAHTLIHIITSFLTPENSNFSYASMICGGNNEKHRNTFFNVGPPNTLIHSLSSAWPDLTGFFDPL